MKTTIHIACAVLLALPTVTPGSKAAAGNEAVALVEGTVSVRELSEKNSAARAAIRLDRWLDDAGVPHCRIKDEDVIKGSLAGAPVAVLCYNPNPPPAELRKLREYLDRGGKLIVFYPADEELAAMMRVNLGKYICADVGRRWSGFSFRTSAAGHFPRMVFQESGNIRPVMPADGRSAVIADWHDSFGKITTLPAWVQSDRGFCMSHILMDGDDENKQHMLVAMIGLFAPSVWRTAAERAVRCSDAIGSFDDFAGIRKALISNSRGKPCEEKVGAALSCAEEQRAEMLRLFSGQSYPQAFEAAKAARDALMRAYALAQSSRPEKFRGVWECSGMGLYPADWERTCKALADSGITAILPAVAKDGLPNYDSVLLPHSDVFERYGDQLKQCIAAAHKKGMETHAWLICLKTPDTPNTLFERSKTSGRLQVSDKGAKVLGWLCPSDPRNVQRLLAIAKEIVTNYSVDGIHLDYIRYADAHACYCDACRKSFETETGNTVPDWPAPAVKGRYAAAYRTWRCKQITALVKAVSEQVRAVKPSVKVSAAVYAGYPRSIESVGQDWILWLDRGYVDFVCPMDYVESVKDFTKIVRDQMKLPFARERVYPGIGVIASESRLDPAEAMEQISVLRSEGASGFVLFSLTPALERETLSLLKLGATAP